VVEVDICEVLVIVGAWDWLGVGELSPWIYVPKLFQERVVGACGRLGVGKLSPWINIPKFVQERVSGASLRRRGISKIKTYIPIACFTVLLGEGRDKSRQLSVLGWQIILTTATLVRNQT
jgi:hypothetical protein